ncbi:hypothetical protein [Paenibacillus xylanilyticus]|uniref:hypothetical protein n=1 Tax=Paenibacillus xylanilyticus TaxID=248903 RepID=UPI0039A2A5F1
MQGVLSLSHKRGAVPSGYKGPFNIRQSYDLEEYKVSLLTSPVLNDLFILIFNQNNLIVEATLKTYKEESSRYIEKNLITGEENEYSKEEIQFKKDNVINAMATCPPGQEWREYNCTNDPELNWVCYAGCAAGLKNLRTCINLCTTNIRRCDADCFPVDGGILV